MKKRNKAEVLSGQRIKIAALLTGMSLLLLSGCGNKAQEAEESQVQTDIAVTATEQTAAAEEQAETTDPETLDYRKPSPSWTSVCSPRPRWHSAAAAPLPVKWRSAPCVR